MKQANYPAARRYFEECRSLRRQQGETDEDPRDLIVGKKLTQVKAAALLGLDQPKVSALISGKLEGYTIDRLLHCLNALGQQVEITVRPVRAGAGVRERMVVVG